MKEFLCEVESNDIGKIQKDVFASKFTTYKVGGLVRAIIYPKNTDKLVLLCKLIRKYNIRNRILCDCSNILFSYNNYEEF